MISFLPTLIFRHKKENLKKCSLRGLETAPSLHFFSYPSASLPPLEGYCLLSLEASETLTAADAAYGLLLLDATWRYATVMAERLALPDSLPKRKLPDSLRTAYPRKQTACTAPHQGLASVEALAVAYAVLGRPYLPLLAHYYWRDLFLEKNAAWFLPG